MKTASSRRVCFQADATATGTETERAASSVQSHESNYNRFDLMRVEQQCRDYWQAVYGQDAERASRGGVAWLWGGCNG